MTIGNGLPPIVGESPAIRRAVELARCFAPTDLPILLIADTGCGKELFAQHVHRWSGRTKEMVDLNCAALPESLVEAELFGHGAEAYTGARNARAGLVEAAHGGTLFLDEVTSLAPVVQGKLLRVLETAEVRRVGETGKRTSRFRLIAAAQGDLAERVRDKQFRRDLYQRMAGVVIEVPPLSTRPEDVIPLASHFAAIHGRVLEPDAEQALLGYAWPGNVRELRHVIERAGHLVENGTLSGEAVRGAIGLGTACGPIGCAPRSTVFALSTDEFVCLCEEAMWRPVRIAGLLGVGRTRLFKELKACGLSLRALRRERTAVRDRSRPFADDGRV